jgi:hypothetical protein
LGVLFVFSLRLKAFKDLAVEKDALEELDLFLWRGG